MGQVPPVLHRFYICFFKEKEDNKEQQLETCGGTCGYDNDREIIHSAVASRVSHAEREQTFNCKEGSRQQVLGRQASKSKLAKASSQASAHI